MDNSEKFQNFFSDNNASKVEIMTEEERENRAKYEEFKQQLEPFKEIATIEEAKELALQIMPLDKEINEIDIGNAKCTIVNRNDMFRISLDSEFEFISYDFE